MLPINVSAFRAVVYVVSFVLTVAIVAVLVGRSSRERRPYWILGCTIASVFWLGLLKGGIASFIGIAITWVFNENYRDSRRIGKRIAHSLGISPNLFFSSLEQSLTRSMYPEFLAELERKKTSTEDARQIILPFLANGLLMLQSRFGPQGQIDAAFKAIAPLIAEMKDLEERAT